MPKKASTRTRTRTKQAEVKEPEVVSEEVVTVEAKAEDVIDEEKINQVVEQKLSALRQSLIDGASKEADNERPKPLQKAGSRNAYKLNANNKDVVKQREGMRIGPARPHRKDVNTKEVVNKDVFYIKD